MLLTVAEFAKEAGITKKKVYDDWNSKLKGYTTIQGGTKMIDDSALKIYRPAQEPHKAHTKNDNEPIEGAQEAEQEEPTSASDKEEPIKKSANDILIEELRNIISTQQAEIEDLKTQAQEAQKRIDEKDEQIREETKRFTDTIQGQLVIIGRQQERLLLLEGPEAENKKKKGLFSRLFGKKKEG